MQAHKTYPDVAHRNGEEGRVVVRFTIARDGHVVSVELSSGSGSASLDDAAQAMLRGAALPPFPSVLPEARMTVTLPIRYTLER